MVKERDDLGQFQDSSPWVSAILESAQQIESHRDDIEHQGPCNDIGTTQAVIIDGNPKDRQNNSMSMESHLQLMGIGKFLLGIKIFVTQ